MESAIPHDGRAHVPSAPAIPDPAHTRAGGPGTAPTASPADVASPAYAYSWPVRVYYEDTDAGGVVYYANYLRFFERCRTEWLRALGFDQATLARREGVIFVVARAELHYRRPARLDDNLAIQVRVAERLAGSMVFEQRALRGTELLCEGRFKVASVDARSFKPTRLPAALGIAFSPPGATPSA